MPIFPSRLLLLTVAVSALALAGCESEEKKREALAAKLREATSIKDQSQDTSFQSFLSRLRQAVAAKDLQTIAGMMPPNFLWRLEPNGEGDGVFAHWDKNNLWPELNRVLRQPFSPSGNVMVSPRAFVTDKNYRGYRAGLAIYQGGWHFVYFVNN